MAKPYSAARKRRSGKAEDKESRSLAGSLK